MSPRPYWKGYLKLALVPCPIALHAVCSSTERASFRQINRKTGNRLRQQLIDEETRLMRKPAATRSAKASISSSRDRSLCSVRRSTSVSSMRTITLP
jgi:hypothetical protein